MDTTKLTDGVSRCSENHPHRRGRPEDEKSSRCAKHKGGLTLAAIIAGTMLAFTSATLPALAAGPVDLGAGENTTFPTYMLGTTKFCVKSLNPNNSARVTIYAGVASEVVTTGGGADESTTCIARSWGSIHIDVVNTRNDMRVPARVWTE